MTQSSLIQFVDSRHGKCSVSVVTLEDGVAVALQLGEKPDVSMRLSGTAAVQLGEQFCRLLEKEPRFPGRGRLAELSGPIKPVRHVSRTRPNAKCNTGLSA